MEREDVVHVLRNMVAAVKPGGHVLDLQVIRPDPVVEAGGHVVCEFDGEPLFRTADAAVVAIEALVRGGRLAEHGLPLLRALDGRCAVRERCRLRRLEVLPA